MRRPDRRRCRASRGSTSTDAVAEARELFALGVKSVLLFGIPAYKDAVASSSYDPDGIVQRAIRAIKAALPEMLVIADLCSCEYTDHGHCGIVNERGDVDNDATVELLCAHACTYAEAGVDVVAPSDMMDGRVGAIRAALDARRYADVAIMAYSAKYASHFTARSAKPPARRRSSATGAVIRWIRRTRAKRCARSRSTSTKAPTS